MSEHKSLTEQEITDACRHMREQLAAPFIDDNGKAGMDLTAVEYDEPMPSNSLVSPCFAVGVSREEWNKEHGIKPWRLWDEIKYRARNVWYALRGDQLFH